MQAHSSSIDRALEFHRSGDFAKACDAYRVVLRTHPKDSRVWSYLGQALEAMGQEEAALEAARQGLRHEPGNLSLQQQYSTALVGLARVDEAIDSWVEFSKQCGGARHARLGLAAQLAAVRRAREAIRVLDDWLARTPDDLEAEFERARLHERLSNEREARAGLERVLSFVPGQIESNVILAKMDVRSGRPREARERLERLLATPEGKERGDVESELALVLDKIGDYAAAFSHALRGQDLNFARLEAWKKDGALHERVIASMRGLSGADVSAWARPSGETMGSAAPIFVVGFPRSGTTLLEQMLAAHPRLAASDESPVLQRVRKAMYVQFQPRGEYPQTLGAFRQKDVDKGRKWYLERIARTVPTTGPSGEPPRRVVDKQPLNTIDLAMVRLILPESPVIFVRRDPRDTVLSVMLQGFTRGVPHLFSLEGTAKLHVLFAEAFAHFEKVLGLRSLIVGYEDLVRDPEKQMRRVLEFVGEKWESAVLRSHESAHRRYVTTPTYADVARPVYSSAIGRWKNYRAQLAPVLPVLEPLVQAGGYEA